MLTLDGHDSHETRELIRAAFDHNVIIILLPSKTTHKPQPLDVGVFSCVQRQWSKHCDERLAQGARINRFSFIPEYLAIHRTISPSLVQKAFANTGIYPLNPTIFNDHDFAPSQASSSIPAFPPSYPDEVPLSVPSEPGEISGCSGDQDNPGSPNSNHSSSTPSPSTDYTTYPALTMLHLPTLPPLPPYDQVMHYTPKEMWNFMRLHQIQCKMALDEATAQRDAANTHCTIARHRIDNLTKQLANKTKSKHQRSKKAAARFLTLPELRGEFDLKDAEDQAKEKADLEKAAQKKADEIARMLRINEEIRNRVFNCPLASYKRKDDLVALAGALSLPMEGTVAELVKEIKDHLTDNPTRENEPRFSGLFGTSRRRSSAMTAGPSSSSALSLIPDSQNHQIPSSSGFMSYTHTPSMSHNVPNTSFMSYNTPSTDTQLMSYNAAPRPSPNTTPLMSHNTPSPNLNMPYLPYNTYSHFDLQGNSS